jgi:DIS3-like exonuclease 2
MAVARKIYTIFPELAVLRRHPPPKATVMKQILSSLNAQNIEINFKSAPELHQCLEKYELEQPELAKVIRANLLKCMELAKYFCTGMLAPSMYSHFALNVPFYTHFTSPIRRYPDILVHRLLDYAVRGEVPQWDKALTQELCSNSNDKRLAAKQASEASSLLFLGLFIAECGTIQQRGSVMKVLDHALDVLLVDLGLTRRVYADKLDIKTFRTRRVQGVSYMEIEWKNGRKQTLTTFSTLTVNLVKGEKPFEFMAIIPPPEDVRPGEEEVITLD